MYIHIEPLCVTKQFQYEPSIYDQMATVSVLAQYIYDQMATARVLGVLIETI